MTTTHIRKMRCGITVEMTLDDGRPQPVFAWTPGPPFTKELFRKIMEEYVPWRDEILDTEAKRVGKAIIVGTLGGKGSRSFVTVFSPDGPPRTHYV